MMMPIRNDSDKTDQVTGKALVTGPVVRRGRL